jgi:polysaccharide pyruvyl transferase WcaK-like protein
MKYAVLAYTTLNIGDDIQSVAAIEFLRKRNIEVATFLNRESLFAYDGEPVKLMMNGWFMNDISRFPPSKKTVPIFLGFHANNEKLIANNIPYFKQHAPIGCRDLWTLNICKKYNIPSFFSGCLTLTLKNKTTLRDNTNLLVDVNNNISYIPNIESIDISKFNGFRHISHECDTSLSTEERLCRARDLIVQYSKANTIITTRLHCALVCRALKTPCIFIHKDYYTDNRFNGLHEILNGGDSLHHKNYGNQRSIDEINLLLNNIELL